MERLIRPIATAADRSAEGDLHIDAGFIERGLLAQAVDQEASHPRGLMPPSPLIPVLLSRPDDVVDWATRRLSGRFDPVPQEIVTVRKTRHGVRPVAELFLRDQLLYRALVAAWSSQLPTPSRSGTAFDAFENGPLSEPSSHYVVSSDISAFYQYIDYELLARELIAKTGDADRVDCLMALLTGVTQQRFGIPQQSQPSDVLAETYIDVLERRLIRRGHQVWRYNDDFRIPAATWADALATVDDLEREARALGLTLNDQKTVIRKRETYAANVRARDDVLQRIAGEAELDLTDATFSLYGDLTDAVPDPQDVQLEAAARILRRWQQNTAEGTSEHALLQLVPLALSIMRGIPASDEVLATCGKLLATEQSLTPAVAIFLTHAPTENEPAVLSAVDDLLAASPYLTPWQASWLAPALGRIPALTSGASGTVRGQWLRSVWDDARTPEHVRASVAQTLARHKLLTSTEILAAYDSLSETNRAIVAGALGTSGLPAGSKKARAVTADDDLVAWMFKWGATFA